MYPRLKMVLNISTKCRTQLQLSFVFQIVGKILADGKLQNTYKYIRQFSYKINLDTISKNSLLPIKQEKM